MVFKRKVIFNKKAQGEQFNWIFIIIAGAIILAFFSVFAMKYIQLKELEQNIGIGRNFAASLNLLQNSPIVGKERGLSVDSTDRESDGAFKIGVNAEMQYFCEENKASIIFNKETRSVQHIEQTFIFTPQKLKINALDIWVLPWYHPFFITNFIFLSDPRANYYFIYDGDNENFVNEIFIPSNINVKKMPVNKINVEKGQIGNFVFFTNSKDSVTKRIKDLSSYFETSTFKHVNFDKQNKEVGDITFFNNGKEEGKSKVYGLTGLWAGIFSSDYLTFNCSYSKAVRKVQNVGNIYLTRIDLLSSIEKNSCVNFYQAIRSNFAKLVNDFSKDGYKQYSTIDKENSDLASRGCAYVY